MKLDFKDIINKEAGKSAIVVGHGPSLKNHLNKIIDTYNSNKDFIIISCNDADFIQEININYWVWANSEGTIKKMYKRLNNRKATIVYADSVDLTPRNEISRLLSVDYLPFDQRHFKEKSCADGPWNSPYAPCCKRIIPGRLTIQEEFQKYTNCHKYDIYSDTVAIHMLYISILLGCKNIYVTGTDLDYSKGYVNNIGKQNQSINETTIKSALAFRPRILETIKFINEAAKNIDRNIYCLDRNLPISNVLEFASLP